MHQMTSIEGQVPEGRESRAGQGHAPQVHQCQARHRHHQSLPLA